MSVRVELTYDMAGLLGVRHLAWAGPGTVQDVLQFTRTQFGEKATTFDQMAKTAAVAVNGVLVSHRQGLRTPVADGDRVGFVKVASGG